MRTVVLATRNRNKVKEIQHILADLPLELKTVDDFTDVPEVEETGATFEENAALKAKAVSAATGCWAIADDSGLEVDALSGRPGVHSARYAGVRASDAENRQRLIEALTGVPAQLRTARFIAVIALASPQGHVRYYRGKCEGIILEEERGSGGFGYDSLFYIGALARTMAEIPAQEKNRISHRAQALTELLEALQQKGQAP